MVASIVVTRYLVIYLLLFVDVGNILTYSFYDAAVTYGVTVLIQTGT